MSTRRDYRVVEMSFDNKDFEKNVQQSIKTLGQLNNALELKDADRGLKNVEQAANNLKLKNVEAAVTDLTAAFSILGVTATKVLISAFSTIKAKFDHMWDNTIGRITGQIKSGGSARAMNIANAQFKLEGLGIDWKKASDDINQAVDGTAYGFDAAANTASQLATAGIELGDAYGGMAHALKAVSGIAAMTNSSYEEIGYIFSQIASAGRLMGQDAMQISTRGINVTATLAKQLNKTTDEIQEMQRKGEISFAMFAEAMNDAFGDQAAKANNTFQGAMSNVKSALSRIGEIFYGPFYDAMIKPLNSIREAINKIKKAFSDGNDATRDFKDRLSDILHTASNVFSYFVDRINFKGVYLLADGLNGILEIIVKIGHGWEKVLGIFDADKAVAENDKLEASLKSLTEAELNAAKAIWNEGAYGNGQDRISNLKAAGFSDEEIDRIQGAIETFIASDQDWAEVEKQVGDAATVTNEKFDERAQNTQSKLVRALRNATTIFNNLKDSVINVGKAFINFGVSGVEAFIDVFHFDAVGNSIVDVSDKIKKFTEKLIDVTKNNTKIKDFFETIVKVVNDINRVFKSVFIIIGNAFGSLVKVLKETVGSFKLNFDGVSKLSDKFASFVEHIKDVIVESGFFIKVFRNVIELIKEAVNFIKTIPDRLKPVYDKMASAFNTISEKIKDITGIDIKGKVKDIIDTLKGLFEAMKNPFEKDTNGQTNISKWAESAKETILGAFDNPSSVFEKVKTWLKDGFEKIKEDPTQLIPEGLTDNLTTLFSGLLDFLKSIASEDTLNIVKKVASILFIIMSLLFAFSANKLVKTIQQPVEAIKTVTSKVVGLFTTLKTVSNNVGNAIIMDLKADAFIKIAIGVSALAAAIIGLGMVDTKTLIKGMTALGFCIVGLAASVAIYNKTVPATNLKVLDTSIIQFGISVAIMGGLVAIFGKMDYEQLAKGLMALVSIMGMYTVVSATLSRFPTVQNGVWKSIVAIAVGIDLVIPFFKIVGEMNWFDVAKGLGALLITMTGLMAVGFALGMLSSLFDAKQAAGFAAAIGIVSLSVLALTPFMLAIGSMDLGSVLKALASFLIVVGSLTAVMLAFEGLDKMGGEALEMIGYAASFALLAQSLNLILPSISALAGLAILNEGALGQAVISFVTIVATLTSGLAVLALFNFSNVLAAAIGLSAVMLAFNAMIPSIIALSMLSADKIKGVTVAILGITGVFAIVVGALAAINAATAGGVLAVLLSLAAVFLSIGISFSMAATALGTAAVGIAAAIKEVVAALKIIHKLDTTEFSDKAKDMVKALAVFFEGLMEYAPTIGAAIGLILSQIATALSESIPDVLSGLGETVFTIFSTIIANMFKIISVIIVEAVKAIVDILETLLSKDGEGQTLLGRLVTIVIDAFLTVMEILTARIDEIAEAVVVWIISLINAIANALDRHSDDISAAVMNWYGALIKVAESLYEEMKKVGKGVAAKLMEGIKEKATDAYNDIKDWVDKRIQNFKDAFGITNEDGKFSKLWKIGKGIIEAWINGIKYMATEAYNAGSDFFNDFLDGLKTAFSDVTGWLTSAGTTILDTFKNALKENSPSKATEEDGVNLLEGLKRGLKNKVAESGLLTDIKGLGKSVLNTFSDSVDLDSWKDKLGGGFDIQSILGDIDVENPTITPILDTSNLTSGMDAFNSNYGTMDYSLGLDTSSNLASSIGYSSDYSSLASSSNSASEINALRNDVKAITEKMSRLEVRLDTGALVGGLYAGIDEKLGEQQILAGRGVIT